MNENTTNEYTVAELTENTTVETAEETSYDLDSVASIGQAAGIMGKGMLGIFIVIGVIILCIYGLNKGGKKKKEKEDD